MPSAGDLLRRLHADLQAGVDAIAESREARGAGDAVDLTVASVRVEVPIGVAAGEEAADGPDDRAAGGDRLSVRAGVDGGTLSATFRPTAPGRGGTETDDAGSPSVRAGGRADRPGDRPPVPARGWPVEAVEGVGPGRGERLRAAGVETVGDLAAADPDAVVETAAVGRERAGKLVAAADLVGLGARPQTAELLAARGISAADLVDVGATAAVETVAGAVRDGDRRLPEDYGADVRELAVLVEAAKRRRGD